MKPPAFVAMLFGLKKDSQGNEIDSLMSARGPIRIASFSNICTKEGTCHVGSSDDA